MKYSGRVQRLNADRLGARIQKPVRPFFVKGRGQRRNCVMMTDIEIAQSTPMKPIGEIAKTAGVAEEYLEYYGR